MYLDLLHLICCLFLYYSVALTTIALVLAMGMMPFNLWVYTRYWASLAVAIPYENLLITLAVTIVPGLIGYLITWRKPKAGMILGKVCIVFSYHWKGPYDTYKNRPKHF